MPKRFFNKILFCEKCLLCGKPLKSNPFLCEVCLFSLKPFPEEDQITLPFLDGYKTFTHYGWREKEWVSFIKFGGFKSLAHFAGNLAKPFLEGYIKDKKPDWVTYIPTNPWRLWFSRGFDPVEEMVKGANLKVEKILRRRWRIRKPLARIKNIEERKRLVKNIFSIEKRFKARLRGKRILVIDDLLSSGATASEVAKLLKAIGVKEVYLFAFFRA
ncbi:MAG TPA: ComF family protein [Aquifex aeolicus]|uniref:ComF family protein n=1 Tax=Aquifex aeolicus TaxID=63363 RepID=A0A9D0YPG0_AQUAO|nr:ComF family protein [Aquificales bacterium]HIP86311.1 ComF family protein [Aquifex sp.]HIP98204.1 ComF family protein [Aquifex aeolicus]HIQ25811.1 ComF family protein [Aquifex aeolicus]